MSSSIPCRDRGTPSSFATLHVLVLLMFVCALFGSADAVQLAGTYTNGGYVQENWIEFGPASVAFTTYTECVQYCASQLDQYSNPMSIAGMSSRNEFALFSTTLSPGTFAPIIVFGSTFNTTTGSYQWTDGRAFDAAVLAPMWAPGYPL